VKFSPAGWAGGRDKHSSAGGDKTSFLCSAGGGVRRGRAMISGRALATRGTLDKLEAIPATARR